MEEPESLMDLFLPDTGEEMNYFTLGEDGKTPVACNLAGFIELYESKKRRVVRQTLVKRGATRYFVSTVFLGIDHNFFGKPPILWETMIFASDVSLFQKRYHTYEEAIEGHAAAFNIACCCAIDGEQL